MPKVAASPLCVELMSSKPKCFNLMIHFSFDAQSDISFQSLTLHTGTDLFLIYDCKSEGDVKMLRVVLYKVFF